MSQTETVYEYLRMNYKDNEPIFLSEISISGIKDVSVRQGMKKLVGEGRLKKFDTGIYFLPGKSIFKSGTSISAGDVIQKKYLTNENGRCGYVGGILFANQLGLTTQVPMLYEVWSNKATTDYRNTKIGNIRVILRKPCVEVTDQNADALQFLDLIKEVDDISEVEGNKLTEHLLSYMNARQISFASLEPYLSYYPTRIYENMYKAGLLNGVSA